MKTQYKIGSSKDNDIVISDKHCPDYHAEINYDKGEWMLTNLDNNKRIYIKNKTVINPTALVKNDIVKIGNKKIYWSNYFYEGESQELYIKDVFSFNGRISRANFRALSLLLIGLAICLFFLPSFLITIGVGRMRLRSTLIFDLTQLVAPFVYAIGYSTIVISFLLLAVKRIRDTGNPIWKLLIPFYNLKILYLTYSKQ